MNKDTENTNEVKKKPPKYYNPDSSLTSWFQKRYELEKKKRDFEENKTEGDKLPNSFYKELKESAARKFEILDKIVFPSMANLVYFLEALEISPTLKNLFEKDLIKLLDPRFVKDDAKTRDMGMNSSSYVFRWNNLARLVSKAVSINNVRRRGDTIKDFRVALLYQLQSIINDEVSHILERNYGFSGQITKSAMKDFGNTLGWFALLAKSVSEEADQDPDRALGFAPITYSNRSGLANLRI